ncbi:hypothetical protein SteCoe_9731 [Stentor coeruleus]|uniref:Uncharacterized protein n=1 Tax=Stentor coeruleus TaxID=5963 RepID=A0A1R2CH45_9CILI|nr:hypothetical protein SteCoe_9731 [Stentor coeruleus]
MMIRNQEKLKPYHFSHVKENVAKCLKNFAPRCASKCLNTGFHQNLDIALHDMVEIQEEFIQKRKKLRHGLHIISTYEEKIAHSISPTVANNQFFIAQTPKHLIIANNRRIGRSLTPIESRLLHLPEKHSNIDLFIECCQGIKEENKRLNRQLPNLGRYMNYGYKKMEHEVEKVKEECSEDPFYYKSLRALNRHIKKMIVY